MRLRGLPRRDGIRHVTGEAETLPRRFFRDREIRITRQAVVHLMKSYPFCFAAATAAFASAASLTTVDRGQTGLGPSKIALAMNMRGPASVLALKFARNSRWSGMPHMTRMPAPPF